MKGKSIQISKIAKQLEISSQKVLDFLQSECPDADISKGIISKIDEKTYGIVLKKFDPEGYKSLEDKKTEDKPDDKIANAQKKQIDIKSRIPEIEEILSSNKNEDDGTVQRKRQRRKICS